MILRHNQPNNNSSISGTKMMMTMTIQSCCWGCVWFIIVFISSSFVSSFTATTIPSPSPIGRGQLQQQHQHSHDLALNAYKPPVQNSVQKLQSSRHKRTSSTSTAKSPPTASPTFSPSQRRATAVATNPTTITADSPRSFEDRMRGLLGRQDVEERRAIQQRRTRSSSSSSTLPSNLHLVHTLEQYKRVVGEEHSKIVVVGFFASEWCKACQAAVPLFYRMAQQFPQVKFVHVPVTASNINLHQGLGISSLPSGHIYMPHIGLVEDSLRMTRKCLTTKTSTEQVQSVSQTLQSYVQGYCDFIAVGDPRSPIDVGC